ncbi:MAG TPA: M1 family aminopeptidase [Terriglobales bacterium]|nr:M1 family aminopeptidase [Terriglobales bacterium]
MYLRRHFACLCICVCLLGSLVTLSSAADAPAPSGPNSDPTYQQLRNIGLGSEAISVSDLTLRRDAASFHLRSGTVCFLAPVQGRVTGAIFSGDGNLVIDPPLVSETRSLKLLTREDEFSENFTRLVLRFTDATYDELKKAGTAATAACDSGLLQDSQNALRHRLRYNLSARILQDILSSEPGGLFVAFIPGKRYNDKMLFAIDPHGVPEFATAVYGDEAYALSLAPEEVVLMTYDENKHGYWASFHLGEEYKNGTASSAQKNAVLHIEHQALDTTIQKNAHLNGKAATTVVSQVNGLRVLPFNLYRTMRVESVTAEGGQPLAFIQQDKGEDFQFFVILPKPLALGEKFTITTTYTGKDAVFNEGGGNYFPVARENWYPSQAGAGLGQYTDYDLTFRIPKGMKIAATGQFVSESNEGGEYVTVWKSVVPLTVAGFNFGKFKKEEAKLTKPEYLVESYANEEPPDWVRSLQYAVSGGDIPRQGSANTPYNMRSTLGTMDTRALMKKALAEGELSIELYSDYFGNIGYKSLAMSQQTACNFGQSWPGLVWLPICSYFDTTVRHQLGLDFGDHGYWKVVAPHEVAHQWWGHTVGFNSYRDQWMSEGFADMSASLFLQMIEKNPQKFITFWNDERDLLVQKNSMGFRGIDAGPLTMGYRLSNTKTGLNLTRHLIYPKGAYILHMIRMMMWDSRTGDQTFKQTMQDFVHTYANRSATTEDFKAIVENHMTPDMKAIGNGKMDWFFNEYVYGTALPSYKFDYSFDKDQTGNVLFNFKVTQSNVDDRFRMLVPLYLELADGRTVNLGRVRVAGSNTVEQKVPLNGLKDAPRRAMINYYDDVLAASN